MILLLNLDEFCQTFLKTAQYSAPSMIILISKLKNETVFELKASHKNKKVMSCRLMRHFIYYDLVQFYQVGSLFHFSHLRTC